MLCLFEVITKETHGVTTFQFITNVRQVDFIVG
jgi:hypothetical protein